MTMMGLPFMVIGVACLTRTSEKYVSVNGNRSVLVASGFETAYSDTLVPYFDMFELITDWIFGSVSTSFIND